MRCGCSEDEWGTGAAKINEVRVQRRWMRCGCSEDEWGAGEKYIINLNYILTNFKRVRVTIFVTKSIFYIINIIIIRYIYDAEGKYFKFIKILKILK